MAIDSVSYDVDVTYSSGSNITGYFYFPETQSQGGVVHIETLTADTTKTITAATHQLNTLNFIVKCFEDGANGPEEVSPNDMSINASGDLTVNFTSAVTGKIIIYAAPRS